MPKFAVTIFLLAGSFSAEAAGDVGVEQAKLFFADYVEKSNASDPAEAGFYCDEGTVTIHRANPDGEVKILVGSASAFKKILRETASEAKSMGDYSQYSRVSYQASRGRVRVDATRTSTMTRQDSPAVFHVGTCANGDVGIIDVVFHTRPAA